MIVRRLAALAARLHTACAVTLGGVLAVLALSGLGLAVLHDLPRLLHPSPPAPNQPPSLAAIARMVDATAATWGMAGARPVIVRAPIVDGEPMQVVVELPDGDWRTLLASPDGGRVLGAMAGEAAIAPLFNLHSRLLAGPAGRILLGGVGLALLALAASGLALWLARRGWRGPVRSVRGLHRWLGVTGLAVLAAVVATGTALAWQPGLTWAAQHLGLAQPRPAPPLGDGAGLAGLDPDDLVAQARQAFPEARVTQVMLPFRKRQRLDVRMRHPDEVHPEGNTFVRFDGAGPPTITDGRTRPLATQVLEHWLYPLHSGLLFGPAGPAISIGCAAVPLVLLASGGWLWWRRRRPPGP